MKNKIYGLESKYYDLLYSFIDYKEQVSYLEKIISRYKETNNLKLLEVACGTGNHIEFLKEKFKIVAFDANKEILKRAIAKHKEVTFFCADMSDFKYNDSFGVVLCLAASIGYLKTYSKLQKTLKNFYRQLEVGGVLIIEPWNFNHQKGKNQNISMLTYDSPDIKIARGSVINKKGIISFCEDTFLITEKGKKTRIFNDTHQLAQFDDEKVLQMIKKIGFTVHLELTSEFYAGKLYVAIKNKN